MEPAWTTCLPQEAAGEGADGVEVAFEVCEFERSSILAFHDTFFAGFAGRADRENRRLNGRTSFEAVAAADFEQAHVALAVIEIPFESGGHGDEAVRTKHAGFLRERIRKARWGDALGPEKGIAFFGDMRNRQDFAIAETDQAFAHTQFRLELRQSLRALARGGKARRKFIEAVNARDFLDQIDFAFDFGAPGRLRSEERRVGKECRSRW